MSVQLPPERSAPPNAFGPGLARVPEGEWKESTYYFQRPEALGNLDLPEVATPSAELLKQVQNECERLQGATQLVGSLFDAANAFKNIARAAAASTQDTGDMTVLSTTAELIFQALTSDAWKEINGFIHWSELQPAARTWLQTEYEKAEQARLEPLRGAVRSVQKLNAERSTPRLRPGAKKGGNDPT